MSALERLLDRIGDLTDLSKPHAMVTLEEFFTDNADTSSIGDERIREFTPQEFLAVLLPLRGRPDVSDVRVEIKPPRTPNGRPSTDTIWIVTSLDRMQLPRQGLTTEFWDRFRPDDWLTFPRLDGRTTEPLDIPNGMRAFGFYYC